MTAQQTTVSLFAGIGVILLIASLVGYALKRTVAKGQPHATIDNLNARIKAWWVMVLVIGCAFLFGKNGVIFLFLFISFASLREFMSLTYTRSGDYLALAASFFIVLPLQYLLIYIGWYGLYSIFIPVYVFLLLPILEVTAGDTKRFLERGAKMQWGLMICVLLHLACARTADARYSRLRGPQPAADRVPRARRAVERRAAVRVGQAVRQAQGRAGRVALEDGRGTRRRRAERHDARRCAVVDHAVSPWQAALMAFAICAMGFFGGLVMSAIKRDRGIKDWGHMIEGMGGCSTGSIRWCSPRRFSSI
jgi:phosphatidate cytidylyltransferase